MDSIEHAMVQTADGTQIRRPDVERSAEQFRRALAARGGSMPAGMRWNETRGFHYASGGRSLAELMERQKEAGREIRMSEVRAEESLVMGASAMAWRWARLFASGGALGWGGSADERAGWQLHRLGYERPPLRVLQRQLARSMR